MGEDKRIEELRKVAEDDCEYSGWINLSKGALEVIAEREAERNSLRQELDSLREALTRLQMGPDTLTQDGLRIVLAALYGDEEEGS